MGFVFVEKWWGNHSKKLLLPLAAIALGGMIYLLYRPQSLLMFEWFEGIGAGGAIAFARKLAGPSFPFLSNWFVNSLPQALWLFGGILWLAGIWNRKEKFQVFFWCGILFLGTVLAEFAQLWKLLPGTFDITDLAGVVAGGAAAALVVKNQWEKESTVQVL